MTVPNPSNVVVDSEEPSFFTPQRVKYLGIAGGVLAVVALAVWFTTTAGSRKEAFAARELDIARMTAESNQIGEATQQFEKIATTYAGTGAAHEATLGIAQARLTVDQNELAIAGLEEYLRKSPPATYAAPAQALLGTALENTGRFAEAEQAYRAAVSAAGTDYLRAAYLLDVGRAAALAGRRDEAKAAYNEIITRYGTTAVRTEAEVRLTELASQPG